MPSIIFAPRRIDITDHIGWLTLTRDRQLNASDLAAARELARATQELARDPSVRAVVIAGEGGSSAPVET